MPAVLRRFADALARQILNWLHRRVDPGSREWLDALIAESECADGSWQRLRWTLGGVPLVWTINTRSRRDEAGRGTMHALIGTGVANIVAIAGWYAVIIAGTYAAARLFDCQLVFSNQLGGCQEHPFAFGAIAVGGALLGVIIALTMRARFAAYWWAVFAVFNTVGAVWYLSSGIVDFPRYGATQSAMLMAATFGVVLAAMVRHVRRADVDAPLQSSGVGAAAPASLLSADRITAHLAAGTISFVLADSVIRARGLQSGADNVNHFAILGSAMIAAMLAGLIGRYGSRQTGGLYEA
jgi:hypothetical protein